MHNVYPSIPRQTNELYREKFATAADVHDRSDQDAGTPRSKIHEHFTYSRTAFATTSSERVETGEFFLFLRNVASAKARP